MDQSTGFTGRYTLSGPHLYTRTDSGNLGFLLRNRSHTGSPSLYLLALRPDGTRSYWSGLFRHGEGLYRADFSGVKYWVRVDGDTLSVTLREAR
jgi:hypothetical protein